jgi:SAM-dependent methyltransferase
LAGGVLDADVRRYQIDLLDLQWQQRWDVAFLLDVLEHIPQDLQVLREAREALRLGGLLFVTVPALKCFWTYNDECAHHVRRYSRADFARLAEGSGMELCYTRYFMFFLSPLLLLSRWFGPDVKKMDQRQLKQHLAQTHRVPSWPVNALLGGIFAAETPLGLWCPFPWGTSVLAVMRRPHD